MVALNATRFRKRLRQARGERSQESVAQAVGLASYQAIQAYESGRVVPKIDMCERLAVALNVRAAWLAGWED